MRVLVTGGAGNIGREVVRLLCERGDEPIIFGRVNSPLSPKDVAVVGDINDRSLLRHSMHGVEGIVHLASMLQYGCDQDPKGAIDENVNGTLTVLEAAREGGVPRFVFASSVAVYGSTRELLREEGPIQTDAPLYGATKLVCEKLLRRYKALYGIACRTVRFSTVLSGRPVRSPGIAAAVAKIMSIGSGNDVVIDEVSASDLRHFVYLKDAAQAAVLALHASEDAGELFNIAGGEDYYLSFEELVDLIRQMCPEAGRVTFRGNSGHRGRVETSRASKELGFSPAYSIRDALKEIMTHVQ